MENYIFKPVTTMKPYNSKHWWVDSHIIPEIRVEADSVKNAVNMFACIVNDNYCVNISNNALKTAEPMFIDAPGGAAVQTGYVITGKMDFERDNCTWSTQYVDIWVEILEIRHPDFLEV